MIVSCAIKDLSSLESFENLRVVQIGHDIYDKTEINLDLTPLKKFKQLETLSISSCSVSNLPSVVKELHFLKTLNFSSVRPFHLPPEVWQLDYLENLSCSGCKMTTFEIKKVSQNSKIHTIRLGSNLLTEIPKALFELPLLHTLWISGNKLTQLYDDVKNATALKNLRAKHNSLDEIEKEKISNLNIETLSV